MYLETRGGRTIITEGISPDWACGKLGGKNTDELTVYVEDEVAASLVQRALSNNTRERVSVVRIGSANAVLRQIASCFLEGRNNCLAILDGDQRKNHAQSIEKISKYCENIGDLDYEEFENWCASRVSYLPGFDWPERWLLETVLNSSNFCLVVEAWLMSDEAEAKLAIEAALREPKHDEFWRLSEITRLSHDRVREDVCQLCLEIEPNAKFYLESLIVRKLP